VRARHFRSDPTRVALALVLAAAWLAAGTAHAQEPAGHEPVVRVTSETALVSAFLWRGWVVHDGFCAQPTNALHVGGLTVSSWFNLALDEPSITEHDLTVEYGRAIGRLTLTGGWIHYFFPVEETDRVTQEVYGAVAWDGPLAPALAVYHDFRVGRGTYLVLSAGHDLPLGHRPAALQVRGSIGYNHRMWIAGSTFSDAAVTVRALLAARGHVTFSPALTYSRGLNPEFAHNRVVVGLFVDIE
jgi:hypothetical protein